MPRSCFSWASASSRRCSPVDSEEPCSDAREWRVVLLIYGVITITIDEVGTYSGRAAMRP